MLVTVNNDNIIVEDPIPSLLSAVREELCYVDKSKQYQMRRMMKSPWFRTSEAFKKLKEEVNGILYSYENNILIFSSTFYMRFEKLLSVGKIIDNRKDTGKVIPLPWVKKPHDLRDYQDEAVKLMLSNSRGLINMATGLGKSLIATHLIKQYRKRSLVVCPSDSVAKQFYSAFVEAFGKNKVGFYGGGKKQISDITVGIAASVVKGVEDFKKAELGIIIYDEVHHCPCNTFYDIAVGLAAVGKVFGLTATDFRSDGKDIMIAAGVGEVIIKRDIKWGIQQGWLAEPYFIVREVKTNGKDFKDDKLKSYKEHVLNCQVMLDRIENDARGMMAGGKSVLILTDMVEHGEKLSIALGVPFAKGEDKKSQDYVDQLNAGKVKGLVGSDSKISEGTDTRNVDCLILANFAGSKGPVIQAIGRGLRKQGTKTKCLILDYKPLGSTMLSRHSDNRVEYYLEITDKVKIIEAT